MISVRIHALLKHFPVKWGKSYMQAAISIVSGRAKKERAAWDSRKGNRLYEEIMAY